jgi:hypothetical protein
VATNFTGDGSTVEQSHSVLNHTKLICRDNNFTPIKEKTATVGTSEKISLDGGDVENTEEEPTVEEEPKKYKAGMHLILNDYYLKQKLAGYDIYKNQKNISINDYRTKIANWTLKFDKFIVEKDTEV